MNLSQNPWQVTPEPKKIHKETQDGVQKKLDFSDVADDGGYGLPQISSGYVIISGHRLLSQPLRFWHHNLKAKTFTIYM